MNAKRYIVILALCSLFVLVGRAIEVPCGSWIELRATAVEDWHFDHWNDGDTSAVRQIEVLNNTKYIAYFAPNCGDYPVLPVISLYDWLLMLDVKAINAMGYYFAPADVTWFRVTGMPDKLTDGASADDTPIASGYYLTIDQSFVGTGDYYAMVDVSSSPSGVLCTDLMRSVLVHYSSSSSAPKRIPVLEPTIVRAAEEQRLLFLNPAFPTMVMVYDMAGRMIQRLTAENADRLILHAAGTEGCYQVLVYNGDEHYVLRYIVVR